MTPLETDDREQIRDQLRDIGRTIRAALPSGWGFALLLFEYGQKGSMHYMSSAARAEMIRAMRELIEKMEHGDDRPTGHAS
jgi:hypothetical protein